MLFFCVEAFSQKLILYGNVDFSAKELYYSFDKTTFSKRQKIKILNENYSVEFPLEKIKKNETLYISTTLKPEEECIYDFNIQEMFDILGREKNIVLQNDFFFECSNIEPLFDYQTLGIETKGLEATDEEKFKLLDEGSRYVDLGSLKLNFQYHKVEAEFPNFMGHLLGGTWSYFPENKEIIIILYKAFHPNIKNQKQMPFLMKIRLEVNFYENNPPYFNIIEINQIEEKYLE